MTDAEKIKLLKEIQAHTTTMSLEAEQSVEAEVAAIDASIEDYNERIAELETKLANEENYKSGNTITDQRELVEELLEESFQEQIETLDREDREYKELLELGNRIFDSYSQEVATLNEEIASIERKLRKNEIAVSKNMRMQLSETEVAELTQELEAKRARVITCEEMQNEYVSELTNYDDLLAANNSKREILIANQTRLNALKADKLNNENSIDKHQLRLDQDELSRLKAGVLALQSRREYVTYDVNAKIDDLIADIEKGKQNDDFVAEPTDLEEQTKGEEPSQPENEEEIEPVPVVPVVDPYDDENERDYESDLTDPSDLDDERKAEVEETNQELLAKKKSERVKAFLSKHKKKFIAAGLGLIILMTSLKGCEKITDVKKNSEPDTKPSYSDEGIEEDKEDDLLFDSQDEPDDEKDNTNLEPTPEPEIEPTPEPDVNPEPVPEPTPEPEVERQIELEAGESIANASDIFGGGNVEDNKISHGEEVGTQLESGIEIKDYTEEGKAVVELPTEAQTQVIEDTNGKSFHQALEDFFGGPISITDEANSYEMGEETSSKTR